MWQILVLAFLLGGCVAGGTAVQIDSASFLVDRAPGEAVPGACRSLYETLETRVAVVPFANNTPFDYAREVQSHVTGASERQARGASAARRAPGGVGVVWGAEERRRFQQDTRMTQREMNARLGESMEDAVLDRIQGIPGIRVYARKDLGKVFDEMKLQQSGMADEATAVRLGKLAGAKLIVTGSFNNIALSYRSTRSIQQGSRDLGTRAAAERRGDDALLAALAGHVMAAAAEAAEGWSVETEILVRVIDVETGEVTFSKGFRGKESLGNAPYPGFAEVVGGVKKAGTRELGELRPALSRQFSTRGYIVQTKTSPDGRRRIARVNLGRKAGLAEGTELTVSLLSELVDPVNGQKICDSSRIPVVLRVTGPVQPDFAWVAVEGDPGGVMQVRAGQIVEIHSR